jgi:hypothetical protein
MTTLFLGYCERHRILPFFLIPHTTHPVQPLDVVLFQPYNHYHGEAVDEATRLGCSNFNKVEFLASLSAIRQKTFVKKSILSSFRKKGLILFDPPIVLNKMREKKWAGEKEGNDKMDNSQKDDSTVGNKGEEAGENNGENNNEQSIEDGNKERCTTPPPPSTPWYNNPTTPTSVRSLNGKQTSSSTLPCRCAPGVVSSSL